MLKIIKKYALLVALIQAIIASMGSLFFSLVLNFTPCTLCWYQRICMYPLVVILAVAILKKDKHVPLYILPLSLTGLLFSVDHNLLGYGVIVENSFYCLPGTSCATPPAMWLGFITIPLLSFVAFAIITLSAIAYQHSLRSTT